jgi:Fic family protein
MSTVERHVWVSAANGPSRRDRRSGEYEVYIPDLLSDRVFTLDGDVAADVADAESALTRFNIEAAALVDTEALARILLRAESSASSRIEGLEIGARRLLRAEAARTLNGVSPDVTAIEVLANIDAMVHGIQQVNSGSPITLELLLEIHQRLLVGSELATHGGQLRTVQNWIGGSAYNPCSAVYVPPPWDLVECLMTDLVTFCNDDGLPAVAQAAIAHAQFETIHPFIDGNGRTGRALTQLILRRRGRASRVLPPVSLILATWAQHYIEGLTATRYKGDANSRDAYEGTNLWIGQFAGACSRAVEDAAVFEARALAIESVWRERLGKIRSKSATDVLLRKLVGAPVLTVASAADLLKKSFVQTNEAVTRLEQAGILHQITIGRRNRAFEAPEIIAAFTDLERQLASPDGDTKTSGPTRPVPHRRKT